MLGKSEQDCLDSDRKRLETYHKNTKDKGGDVSAYSKWPEIIRYGPFGDLNTHSHKIHRISPIKMNNNCSLHWLKYATHFVFIEFRIET